MKEGPTTIIVNNRGIKLLFGVSCVPGRQVPVTTWLHKQARLWPLCSTVRCVWSAERLLMWACSIQDPSLCQNKQPSPEHTHYKGQVECAAQHLVQNTGYTNIHRRVVLIYTKKKKQHHMHMVNQSIKIFLH